jgi:hypothetical protein
MACEDCKFRIVITGTSMLFEEAAGLPSGKLVSFRGAQPASACTSQAPRYGKDLSDQEPIDRHPDSGRMQLDRRLPCRGLHRLKEAATLMESISASSPIGVARHKKWRARRGRPGWDPESCLNQDWREKNGGYVNQITLAL